jgi:ubiquinone/menaquinone biosynthesis C-methylase UbiE
MSEDVVRGGIVERYQSPEMVERWRRTAAGRAQVLGPVTELMLDLVGLAEGMRVLDVGAGTGEQTLLVARRVGSSGHVLAVDSSPAMLAHAAEAAREAGLDNVETRVMDAHDLDLESDSFDAIVSRNVLMLLDAPTLSLEEQRRVLRTGGKCGAIVFSTGEKNPSFSLPAAIARRIGGLPEPAPNEPGMSALGAPGLLEDVFAEAGFREVAVRPVATLRRLGSPAEAVETLKNTSPTLLELLPRLTEEQQARAWAEIEAMYRQHAGPTGVEMPGESLIGVGTK